MGSLEDAVLLSLILTALLAIPTAAENVDIEESESDRFSAEIGSEFSQNYRIDFSEGREFQQMEDSRYKLTQNFTSNAEVKKIETPEGSLTEIYVNATTYREKVVTPYGTLETGLYKGRQVDEFRGANRTEVENLKEELENQMDEALQNSAENREVAMSEVLPEIRVEVQEGENEHVNITNMEDETIDLSGWQIESKTSSYSDSYNIGPQKLESGEKISFYSDSPVNPSENSIYGTGMTLYSNSGTLEIYDGNDMLVEEYEYS